MKLNQLKELIREAVEEVIRDEMQVLKEELADLLKPVLVGPKPPRPTLKELVNIPDEARQVRSSLREAYINKIGGGGEDPYAIRPISPVTGPAEVPLSGNPYADLLAETAENITAQDIKGIRNLGS